MISNITRWATTAILMVVAVGCAAASGPADLLCRTDGLLGACCDATTPCDKGFVCSGYDGNGKCVIGCDPSKQDCPDAYVCVQTNQGHQCLTVGGLVGDRCTSADQCRPELTCVDIGNGGLCTAQCDVDTPCPAVATVGERICIRLTGGVGNYCLAPCETTSDCASELTCTPVGDFGLSVCFPNFE